MIFAAFWLSGWGSSFLFAPKVIRWQDNQSISWYEDSVIRVIV